VSHGELGLEKVPKRYYILFEWLPIKTIMQQVIDNIEFLSLEDSNYSVCLLV